MQIGRNSMYWLMQAIEAAARGEGFLGPRNSGYPYKHLEASHKKRGLKRKKRAKQFAKKR